MLAVYITIAVLVVIITRLLIKHRAKVAYFNTFPGPPPEDFSYITGNMHLFSGWNEEAIACQLDLMKKHKYMYRLFYGPFMPVIYFCHPDSVKILYKGSIKPFGNFFIRTAGEMGIPWIGEGLLLIQSGRRWQRNRRLISPAFHNNILKTYVKAFNKTADVFVKQIRSLSENQDSFDISPLSSLQSLDALLRCGFSFESHCQERGSGYVTAITELAALWQERILTPTYCNNWVYALSSKGRRFAQLCKMVHEVSNDVIVKRREALETEPLEDKKMRDFLDILLTVRDSTGTGLGHLEIRNEVDTFLFAGHYTTAVGITFTLYCLAKYPKYQEQVFREVSEICGDKDDLEWEDLDNLPITTMVIKESLRLFPAIPTIGRESDIEMEVCGYKLPKHTLVSLPIYMLHRNPLVWDNPDEFIPERFATEKLKDMDPYQYLPFSAGARNCIGQNFVMAEMKTVIPKVVKNFRISADENRPPRLQFAITLCSDNGVNLYFQPRVNKTI